MHIGVRDLKFIAYHAVLPYSLKWSKGFPLPFDECELCSSLWVEHVPKNLDVDAIAEKFFNYSRSKNKAIKTFSPKQGTDLYIAISHEKYECILNHLANEDDAKSGDRLVRVF